MIKALALSGFIMAIIAFTFSPFLILTSTGLAVLGDREPLKFIITEKKPMEEYVCRDPKKLMRKTYARS